MLGWPSHVQRLLHFGHLLPVVYPQEIPNELHVPRLGRHDGATRRVIFPRVERWHSACLGNPNKGAGVWARDSSAGFPGEDDRHRGGFRAVGRKKRLAARCFRCRLRRLRVFLRSSALLLDSDVSRLPSIGARRRPRKSCSLRSFRWQSLVFHFQRRKTRLLRSSEPRRKLLYNCRSVSFVIAVNDEHASPPRWRLVVSSASKLDFRRHGRRRRPQLKDIAPPWMQPALVFLHTHLSLVTVDRAAEHAHHPAVLHPEGSEALLADAVADREAPLVASATDGDVLGVAARRRRVGVDTVSAQVFYRISADEATGHVVQLRRLDRVSVAR
mmetsp:Transcript_18557/g.70188  ORF Transcript_18557/g.70188 Transcript_18557/m.70188 type:complete len:328 (+) Transcript_18557:101-1084(+)